MGEDNAFDELGEKIGRLARNKLNKVKGKLIRKLLPFLLGIILVVVVIMIIFGAFMSLTEKIEDFFDDSPDLSSMTDEERNEWLNDAGNIADAINDGLIELDAETFLNLDKDTVTRIMDRIVEYEKRRKKTRTVSYTYRVEQKVDRKGNAIALEEMDKYGTIGSDSSDAASSTISYTDTTNIELSRNDIENISDENGKGVFDVRWQPIFTLCAMAAQTNYDNWGAYNDKYEDAALLEDTDFSGYYLSDEMIDNIIDIFYFKASYYYDAVDDTRTSYKFRKFNKLGIAYKLESYLDGNQRITKRIPCSAPVAIQNGYITYSYSYNQDGFCTSRDYTLNPQHFYDACTACDSEFEMDTFVELLSELPAAEDLVDFYQSGGFATGYIENSSCTDKSVCASIGVIYHPTKDGGGEIVGDIEIDWDGESFSIPVYDYPEEGLDVNEEPGKDYALYPVSGFALKSGAQSDGLSEEQIVYVLQNYSYFARATNCPLFQVGEIEKTAHSLWQFQEDNSLSVLFILGILPTEGAIISENGSKYYNFFNMTTTEVSKPHFNKKGHMFIDYYTLYNGDLQAAFNEQLQKFSNLWFDKRGRTNYFQFCWNGYDCKTWTSLSDCYCPLYDDTGYKGGGAGWCNNCALFRKQMETLVREAYPDWTGSPFDEDTIDVGESFGSGFIDWFKNLFGKGDKEEETETTESAQ